MKKYIQLYANCILVSGVQRTLICDLQRSSLFTVPEGVREIFQDHKGTSLEELYQLYDDALHAKIKAFLEHLVEEDLAFITTEPESFPELSLEWRNPRHITNAIFDFDKDSTHDIKPLVEQLTEMGCEAVELRFFCSVSWERVQNMVQLFEQTKVRNIRLYVKYSEALLEWDFEYFFVQYQRVSSLMAHSAPEEKVIYESPHFANVGAYSVPSVIKDASHCGAIGTQFFAVNIPTFTEAQHHNTCLNRKIGVDTRGNIKNCPSMAQAFGHVSDVSLKALVNNPHFTKMWNITKDEISKCKTCEFRYICTDCRAYREDPRDMYSAPLKCGYNPETCEWEEWSTNPLKQQAIHHYHLTI